MRSLLFAICLAAGIGHSIAAVIVDDFSDGAAGWLPSASRIWSVVQPAPGSFVYRGDLAGDALTTKTNISLGSAWTLDVDVQFQSYYANNQRSVASLALFPSYAGVQVEASADMRSNGSVDINVSWFDTSSQTWQTVLDTGLTPGATSACHLQLIRLAGANTLTFTVISGNGFVYSGVTAPIPLAFLNTMRFPGFRANFGRIDFSRLVISTPSMAQLGDSVVGYWPLNEGAGHFLNDAGGNNPPGVLELDGGDGTKNGMFGATNSPWAADPLGHWKGSVLGFSNLTTSAFALLGDGLVPILTETNALTLSIWHKPVAVGKGNMVFGSRFATNGAQSLSSSGAGREFLKLCGSQIQFQVSNAAVAGTPLLYPQNESPADDWILHTLVKEGLILHYYRNGVEATNVLLPSSAFPTANAWPLMVANDGWNGSDNVGVAGSNPTAGYYTEAAEWGRALSPNDVLSLYQMGAAGGRLAGTNSPVITSQPSALNVGLGQTAIFSVAAIGTPPLQYQWFFNNGILPGKTNATLILTNVMPAMNGGYSVQVNNGAATAASSAMAPLAVQLPPPPVITQPPADVTVDSGQTAAFTVSATGTPPVQYQWYQETNALLGQTNSLLILPNVAANQTGGYTVAVSDSFGQTTSSRVAVLTVIVLAPPVITQQPQSPLEAAWGGSATFGVGVDGTPPFQYQWYYGSQAILAATNSSLTLQGVTTNQAGYYTVLVSNRTGVVTISGAGLLIVDLPPPPVVTLQPVDVSLAAGGTATFTVGASGIPPVQYQWYVGSLSLAGQTNALLILNNVATNQSGIYYAVVNNPSGLAVASLGARLTVTNSSPPAITQQPVDVTANRGGTASFSVAAIGTPPISYQWYRGGIPLAGATAAAFALQNLATNQAGLYQVVVTSPYGIATSSNAVLVVNDPTAPPANDLFANRTVITGLSASATNSNANATKEPGEPSHAGVTGGRSLWWTWTAPQSGTVTIDTSGSAIDTALAVYMGSSLTALTSVAANDDSPLGGTSSLVTFRAQTGVPYQIAVDSFGGQSGFIELNLSLQADQPVLRVAPSGQNVVLSWPTNAAGFNLQTTDNLGSGLWTPSTFAPSVAGNNYQVKFPLSAAAQFYRLGSP